MTNKEQIIYSLLPRAEGLLLGTISGMEVENFNREGAAKTLTNTIALLHKVRLLLEQELDSEPQLPKNDVSGNEFALPLMRELVMRGQFAFPENEDDLKWFDEGINHNFMEELMLKLSLGKEIEGNDR